MIKKLLVLIVFICFFQNQMYSQEAKNQYMARSTTGVSGSSETITVNNKSYIIQQSVGQSSVIGTHQSGGVILRQGFIQPPTISAQVVNEETNMQAVIYPNPFDSQITIAFSDLINEPLSIFIYDTLGRVVYKSELKATQNAVLNLNFLSSALYVLQVASGNKQFKANLIKQ